MMTAADLNHLVGKVCTCKAPYAISLQDRWATEHDQFVVLKVEDDYPGHVTVTLLSQDGHLVRYWHWTGFVDANIKPVVVANT